MDDDDDDDDDATTTMPTPNDDPTIQLRFSAAEVLRNKDFGAYSDDELRLAQQLMTRLRFVGPPRRSLRLEPAPPRPAPARRAPHRPGVAAGRRRADPPLLARAGRTHAPAGAAARRQRIDGAYARALLRFVQAAVAGRQRVEAFAMGTRLTRVTKELGSRDPDKALRLASERVTDWSGGTRLGECLRRFNDEWGVRGHGSRRDRGRAQRRLGPRQDDDE